MQTCLCHRQGKRTWPDRDSNTGSLNLNSLLVNRQINNPSPGAVTGKLVPSSHKRGELRYAIILQFRGRNQGLGEVIPVPDSLGEEAILIDIFTD